MFTGCSNLLELNDRRRQLIASSPKEVAAINAAYNKARQDLVARKPTYRRPPSFSCQTPDTPKGYVPMAVSLGHVPKNTLVVKGNQVLI